MVAGFGWRLRCKNFTSIKGYNSSAAELYANNNGIAFISLDEDITISTTNMTSSITTSTTTSKTKINYGDANCDNDVSVADAVLIMQSISNPSKYGIKGTDQNRITVQGLVNADCCNVGDGVTNADALAIQKYKLSLIASLPEKK